MNLNQGDIMQINCIMRFLTCFFLFTMVNITQIYADDCHTTVKNITTNKSVTLLSINCKNLYGKPQHIHVLDANLNDKKIGLKPVKAADDQLHPLPYIAKENSKIIAGVNASFFYFNPKNSPDYFDEICPTKTYPQRGSFGNSLMQVDGKIISTNCSNNFNGSGSYARSVFGINKNGSPFIQLLSPGIPLKVNGDIIDAVGAGPNLVSSDIQGNPYVNITNEGFGQWLKITSLAGLNSKEYYAVPASINIADKMSWSFDVIAPNGEQLNMRYHVAAAFYGNAPRTAIGLRKDNHLFLITVDGGDPACGLLKVSADPSSSSFADILGALSGNDAVILFNNNLFYADHNNQEIKKINITDNKNKDANALILKFMDSYKLANAHEIQLIESITGRVLERKGMTLNQLAQFMIDYLHVNSALNLDGGGSTTMYIAGHNPEVLTWNKDHLREVFNGLFLINK